ncbi:type I restriction-modification system methyltransferase subunit-like protein [Rhodovulum sulfidophilum]|uniref:Type I restriction-modification system methyltransferase subunit-like protein n=1 Tax=Rhodovulum sulfidophilum TaxID=35806 RepID=A0A0D6AYQ1_RHOSU|nr:type I restriction-modification system methyltransferase subunit-like protein [Rhodovulum sulfidophilum]
MNADRLLEVYEQISEAPDAIARLRRFVLDLAARGKLVEQDAGDEPASELVSRLEAGKERLVKTKVIKKPRELGGDDELIPPYDIPVSWQWCRLDSVGAIVGGGTPSAGDSSNFETPGSGVAWLTPADLGGYAHLYISRGARDLSDKGLYSSSATLMPTGSVLFTSRAPIGYVAIAENPIATNQGFKSVVPFLSDCSQYIALTLKALATEIDAKASGTTFKEVSGKIVAGIPFPLPPLAEQHRIIAKVDELMALCGRLEEARKTREEVRDKLTAASLSRLTAPDTTAQAKPAKVGTGFGSGSASTEDDFPTYAAFALEALPALTTRPDQIKTLRQTILNLAVRGKLVEQETADEPASELLERIEDERARLVAEGIIRSKKPPVPLDGGIAPFEPPSGWRWTTLAHVFVVTGGIQKTPARTPQNHAFPYLGVGNVYRNKIDLSNLKKFELQDGELEKFSLKPFDIMVVEGNGSASEIGRCAIWEGQIENCVHQNHLIRCRPIAPEIARYALLYLNSPLGMENMAELAITSAGLYNLSVGKISKIAMPFPPLAEQHRIVAKVDALMALCDRLEAALTTADTTRIRLLEALLHEALEPATDALEAAE